MWSRNLWMYQSLNLNQFENRVQQKIKKKTAKKPKIVLQEDKRAFKKEDYNKIQGLIRIRPIKSKHHPSVIMSNSKTPMLKDTYQMQGPFQRMQNNYKQKQK